MTPKKKAIELVDKMSIDRDINKGQNIKFALIAVDEIMEFLIQASEYLAFPEQIKYWQEVKQEIQKL